MTTREFEIPNPPEDLSKVSKNLYHLHAGTGTVKTPVAVETLILGLKARDLAAETAKVLKDQGATETSKRSNLTRSRAELRIHNDAMATWLKVVKALHLTMNSMPDEEGLGYKDAFRPIPTKRGNDPEA